MNVLVMGGTQFNGLALVRELCKHGHSVSILNRGKTEAPIPRGVERLLADRTDHSALRATLSGLDFDCVYDISAYRLEDVERMTEIFRGHTGHYIFASSTVIYAASNLLPISENHTVDRSDRQNEYGLNKLLCEDHLMRENRERGFPATIAAFSMVFGPRNILPDREQRMFIRLKQGRKVMIPGDGTTLGQVGHVDDEARALRMMMCQPVTFGKRYNLTGGDCFSDEGYVDTCADVVGLAPEEVQKVWIPDSLMEDLYSGRVRLGGGAMKAHVDVRTTRSGRRRDERSAYLFQIQRIIQRIAPHIHHWNKSVFFSTERLRKDIGWTPDYSFPAAAEQTWQWMQSEGLDRSLEFDFSFEDELIDRIERA